MPMVTSVANIFYRTRNEGSNGVLDDLNRISLSPDRLPRNYYRGLEYFGSDVAIARNKLYSVTSEDGIHFDFRATFVNLLIL